MKKNRRRVLARQLATELRPEDLRAVTAGAPTNAMTFRAPDYQAEADVVEDDPEAT